MVMTTNLNCTCPECGKKFHACPSCGLPHIYEYEYCSLECYQKSLKYREKFNTIKNLINDFKKDVSNLTSLYDYIDEKIDEDELPIILLDIKEHEYE